MEDVFDFLMCLWLGLLPCDLYNAKLMGPVPFKLSSAKRERIFTFLGSFIDQNGVFKIFIKMKFLLNRGLFSFKILCYPSHITQFRKKEKKLRILHMIRNIKALAYHVYIHKKLFL